MNYAYDTLPDERGEPTEHTCSFCGERMAVEEHAGHECDFQDASE